MTPHAPPQFSTLTPRDLNHCLRGVPAIVRDTLQAPAFQGKVFLAGGLIRSRITGEKVNDVDLLVDSGQTAEAVEAYLIARLDTLPQGPPRVHRSQNAVTFRLLGVPAIQVIRRWTYSTPEQLLASFDFTIACAAIWYGPTASHPRGAYQSLTASTYYADLAARRLVYLSPRRSEDAGGSMLRVLKFYQRGYYIPLDSLAGVIARLTTGVREVKVPEDTLAYLYRGLLTEVDPNAGVDWTNPALTTVDEEEGTPEDVSRVDGGAA